MGFIKQERFRKEIKSLFMIVIGVLLFAFGVNCFINPSGLYTGGVTGISQIIMRYVETNFGVKLNLGMLIWSMNIPLLIISYKVNGKRFTLHTLYTITVLNIALNIVPQLQFSDDLLLNAVFGGVFFAMGIGLVLRYGGSTGGLDILSQYMSTKKHGSFGQYSFYLNAVIVGVAGFFDGWEISLYTILLIFVQTQFIDKIHTPHKNYTIFIVTTKRNEVTTKLQAQLKRGMTVINAEGAYTHTNKSLLMMVVSSYELYMALENIREIDPNSFTNVIQSDRIQGNFVRKVMDKGQ
ncbi:MAG TPA: YitT family protein [Firmicutes bacterium]|nr:YitT family protein [Bacillota bacterium]